MNNRTHFLQIGILIVLAVAAIYLIPHTVKAPAPTITTFEDCVKAGGTVSGNKCTTPEGNCCYATKPQTNPDVIVDTPLPNTVVASPLVVKGRAQNSWYFEASLPGRIRDATGNIIAEQPFHAITDWMTPGYVDFSETMTFAMPATQTGTLEIHNDNPSGDPINDKVFTVPIKFW